MKLTDEEISSIAESLDAGLKIYVHTETHEKIEILDYDEMYSSMDAWRDDIKKVEKNRDKYFEFEKMDSREGFRVMENFVDNLENEELRKQLDLGLNLLKPFRNFKDIIDSSGEYRQKWFEHKHAKYMEYVREQLEWQNNRLNKIF